MTNSKEHPNSRFGEGRETICADSIGCNGSGAISTREYWAAGSHNWVKSFQKEHSYMAYCLFKRSLCNIPDVLI